MESFGKRLARFRTRRGWTQKELAARSGVPYMTIYRLEEGIYEDTRTATAAKLARTLGISLDVLAGLYETDDQFEAAMTVMLGRETVMADDALIVGGIAKIF